MNKILSYKGYQTSIEYSAEDGCFVGHLRDIDDIVGFHGETRDEAVRDFHEAVDFYLESCVRAGEAPCQPDKNIKDPFYSTSNQRRLKHAAKEFQEGKNIVYHDLIEA